MECISPRLEIEKTFSNVRTFSFVEKRSPLLDEEKVNSFLDAILDLKNILSDKINKVYDINRHIEELTWLNDLSDECLMSINDLISAAKDLQSTLIRQYVSMNFFRKKGLAKEEIKEFKNSIDELKEAYEDLESVFFFLPEFQGFVETTKQLSLI